MPPKKRPRLSKRANKAAGDPEPAEPTDEISGENSGQNSDPEEVDTLGPEATRGGLMVGVFSIKAAYGKAVNGVREWHGAVVVPSDKSTGPQSLRIRWLLETDEENVYEYERRKPWHTCQNIARARVIEMPEATTEGEGDAQRWRLVVADVAQSERVGEQEPEPEPEPPPCQRRQRVTDADCLQKREALRASMEAPSDRASDEIIDLEEYTLVLSGPFGLQRQGSVLLTNNPREWLTDSHLANLLALRKAELEKKSLWIRLLYPSATDTLLHARKDEDRRQTTVLSALRGELAEPLAQVFCSGSHWHVLIVLARCADVIYWEATGGSAALRARHPLFSAIDTVIAEAGAGPRPKLRAMQLRLQSDGWNCGVWAVVLVEKLIEFVDAGGSGSLDDFMRADTRFVDMSAQVGQKKREADARNKAFIGAQRDRFRTELRDAAGRDGLLFVGSSLLE
mmetsp:Transcript_16095/g.51367  ORF Transcript_16095/g.51367 Transcript_16095/m.51367 type:complete len:453 (-) Transcript_16095:205-1563(-)